MVNGRTNFGVNMGMPIGTLPIPPPMPFPGSAKCLLPHFVHESNTVIFEQNSEIPSLATETNMAK